MVEKISSGSIFALLPTNALLLALSMYNMEHVSIQFHSQIHSK